MVALAIANFCGYIWAFHDVYVLEKDLPCDHNAFWHSAIYSIGWIIGFMWRPCQHDLYISLSSHHSLHRPYHPAWSFLLMCPPGDLQGTQVLQLRLPAKNLHQRAPSNWAKWRNVFVQLAGAYSRFQLRLVTTSATEKERCSALKVDS